MQALQKHTSNESIKHTDTKATSSWVPFWIGALTSITNVARFGRMCAAGLRKSDMILIRQYDTTKFLNQIYYLALCAIASGLMFSGCLLGMMCIHAGVGLVQSCANFRGKLFSCLFVIILKTRTEQEGTSPYCASPPFGLVHFAS